MHKNILALPFTISTQASFITRPPSDFCSLDFLLDTCTLNTAAQFDLLCSSFLQTPNSLLVLFNSPLLPPPSSLRPRPIISFFFPRLSAHPAAVRPPVNTLHSSLFTRFTKLLSISARREQSSAGWKGASFFFSFSFFPSPQGSDNELHHWPFIALAVIEFTRDNNMPTTWWRCFFFLSRLYKAALCV